MPSVVNCEHDIFQTWLLVGKLNSIAASKKGNSGSQKVTA
jgi:hypothetical protein